MFTGLIEEIGQILTIQDVSAEASSTPSSFEGKRLEVGAQLVLKDLKLGDSVSVDGACTTVVELSSKSFWVEVTPETLSKTLFQTYEVGTSVNLERPLRLNDRLGGHYVSGHVDGFAQLLSVQEVGNSWVYRFRLENPDLSPLIVEKGSICLSGISLTVNTVEGNVFSVAIIPHTMEKTTLGQVEVGDRVNVEMDILGKYVQRLLSCGSLSQGEAADGSEVSAVEDKTGLGLVKTTKIFSGSWFNHD